MEWLIGLVVLFILAAIFGGPGRCDVCRAPIKKAYYTWKLEGKKQKLCPHCNAQMERRISKQAFKNRFG